MTTAFKVAKNGFVVTWTNNFLDLTGELFTQKAMDDYVSRIDAGTAPLPELWIWHTPGTRTGQADWIDRHGHFLMAGGTFDDTPRGRKAKAYYASNADQLGISHGFTFARNDFDGVHYHRFTTFEISPLPREDAANLYTALSGVKSMEANSKKKKHLVDIVGTAEADRILADLEKSGKSLEDAGVAFKSFSGIKQSYRHRFTGLEVPVSSFWKPVPTQGAKSNKKHTVTLVDAFWRGAVGNKDLDELDILDAINAMAAALAIPQAFIDDLSRTTSQDAMYNALKAQLEAKGGTLELVVEVNKPNA